MSDSRKHAPTHNLPALSAQRMPARSSVHLPASSGAWFGPRTRILKKDTNWVRTHTEFLDARAAQARSAQAVVDARIELARSLMRLDWLPEILEADYIRGKLDRAHEIEMARITHQTAEAQARVSLAAARLLLTSYEPPPPDDAAPPPSSASPGLTPTEVENVIRNSLPEITPETLRSLVLLLRGVADEKKG